ncbi:hypothetical protein MKW98_032224 [Papaver atlanticum]|uniref:Uncharacterized protein n=1 Tax=Papaver atlanticum TaxID=357466 RepID=A0AAD4XCK3_9MAGN|nr:hypothetical protein MKW98_032224 [Papaver atlanticum]
MGYAHCQFLLRFGVEHNTGSAVFVTLDSELQKLVHHTAYKLIGGLHWGLNPESQKCLLFTVKSYRLCVSTGVSKASVVL